MIMCYFVRSAMCKGSVYCKNISDKIPHDGSPQLIRRFGKFIVYVSEIIFFFDCVIPS
jgi:hypothetical protein